MIELLNAGAWDLMRVGFWVMIGVTSASALIVIVLLLIAAMIKGFVE